MRPIDKGNDLGEFRPHRKAQQPLTERLGDYCSYCERWVSGGIHVEHKKPKVFYPEDQFLWNNFLLSCSNCNPSKGKTLTNLDDYLWPDSDNTFRAFIYDSEGRVLPNKIFSDTINQKIHNTWIMLGLNRHADIHVQGMQKPTDKDKRSIHRKQAWQNAEKKKSGLGKYDTAERRNEIVSFARERGFWSVWMTVFADDSDMCDRFIRAFIGTSRSCFDDTMKPVHRPLGQI